MSNILGFIWKVDCNYNALRMGFLLHYGLCFCPTVATWPSVTSDVVAFDPKGGQQVYERDWSQKKALHVVVWIAEMFSDGTSLLSLLLIPLLCVLDRCFHCPSFSESIVVQYTQYVLNVAKIFLIKGGLVTGTQQDSPLGKALCTKLYQNFPCVVALIYFLDKRDAFILEERENLSKYLPFMCIILFFKVRGQLLLNKEWGNSFKK